MPFGLIVYVLGLFDTVSPFFKQHKVGEIKKPFTLLKFRIMCVNTKFIATHLANSGSVTRLGFFLRKSKLDELPQSINVLRGGMSLVGGRPNLFNQKELIKKTEERRVCNFLLGIPGLAQINEIDMSTPKKLAKVDAEMLSSLTTKKYFQYILATVGVKALEIELRNNKITTELRNFLSLFFII